MLGVESILTEDTKYAGMVLADANLSGSTAQGVMLAETRHRLARAVSVDTYFKIYGGKALAVSIVAAEFVKR